MCPLQRDDVVEVKITGLVEYYSEIVTIPEAGYYMAF
jgi:hypothetical protein